MLMWQNTPSYPLGETGADKAGGVKNGGTFLVLRSLDGDSPRSVNAAANACTWHADAVEAADLVQAGGVIVARVGHAFVDVHLAARSFVPLQTLALERAFGVDTATAVLTRIGTYDIQDTGC